MKSRLSNGKEQTMSEDRWWRYLMLMLTVIQMLLGIIIAIIAN